MSIYCLVDLLVVYMTTLSEASNNRLMIDAEGSGHCLIKVLYRKSPGETEQKTRKLRHDMRCPARNLILGLPQYEAGVSTRPRRSVDRDCCVSTSEMLSVL